MHLDYPQFTALDTQILALTHDDLENAKVYFSKNHLPFPGLVDTDHKIYDQYDVASKTLALGQRPGLFIVDKESIVQYAYVGYQQWEIPPNQQVLKILQEIQG